MALHPKAATAPPIQSGTWLQNSSSRLAIVLSAKRSVTYCLAVKKLFGILPVKALPCKSTCKGSHWGACCKKVAGSVPCKAWCAKLTRVKCGRLAKLGKGPEIRCVLDGVVAGLAMEMERKLVQRFNSNGSVPVHWLLLKWSVCKLTSRPSVVGNVPVKALSCNDKCCK